jgi:hypothetical protein
MSGRNSKIKPWRQSYVSQCALERLERRVHFSADSRGKISIIVEAGVATALTTELSQYQQDLIGDGWRVSLHTDAPLMRDDQNVWNN